MKKTLKIIGAGFFSALLLSASCNKLPTELTEDGYTKAYITYSNAQPGCPYVIVPTGDGEEMHYSDGKPIYYNAIDLPEAYQKPGYIEMKFRRSKAPNTCNHTAPIVIEDMRPSSNPSIDGNVIMSDSNCVLIEAMITPKDTQLFYPINLEEKYQTEGMKITFEFSYSRAMLPAGCPADYSVSITKIRSN